MPHLSIFPRHSRNSSQSRRQRACALFERDLQAVRDEGDKDMCLDAFIRLMIDRSDSQVIFEYLKGLLDFRELDVVLPKHGRITAVVRFLWKVHVMSYHVQILVLRIRVILGVIEDCYYSDNLFQTRNNAAVEYLGGKNLSRNSVSRIR